ncbi:MAG: TetR/AcrR family transcriptional regulator [Acidiferrobacterales bacterium]|nr:TetR/AcrR family transcriptional regulator [Betaproteobacteria bacterium]
MSAPTDTRERILATARNLIYARSYTDVGVAEICERAGVFKGSFYHFFPSKRDLTLAVLDFILAETKERLLDRAFDPGIPPLDRLDRLAELAYGIQKEWAAPGGRVLGCPVGNLATELATQDEAIRAATARAFARLQRLLRQTLEEAVDSGALPAVDLDATAQAMVAYFEGVLMLAKTENDLKVIRRLLPALRHIRVPIKQSRKK